MAYKMYLTALILILQYTLPIHNNFQNLTLYAAQYAVYNITIMYNYYIIVY